MPDSEVKDHHKKWLDALSTTENTAVCGLVRIVFDLSSVKEMLEEVLVCDLNKTVLNKKKDSCLSLFTSSLAANGMRTLADLEGMPSDLVSMIPKIPWLGQYLPHPLVAALILA